MASNAFYYKVDKCMTNAKIRISQILEGILHFTIHLELVQQDVRSNALLRLSDLNIDFLAIYGCIRN